MPSGLTVASVSSQSSPVPIRSESNPSPSWSSSLVPEQSWSTPSYQVSAAPGWIASSASSQSSSLLTSPVAPSQPVLPTVPSPYPSPSESTYQRALPLSGSFRSATPS